MEINVENVRSQMRKGMLEYCILSILDKQEAYASSIIDALKEAGLIVVEGTLYPLLIRLKNQGSLTYRWEESPQGPPRKYYGISEDGRALLSAMDASWNDLVETINTLKQ
jgi:PadR family transcriptional regulator PadR